MAYATTNPFTNETIKTFPNATNEEVKAALDTANDAFLAWRETNFEVRGKIL